MLTSTEDGGINRDAEVKVEVEDAGGGKLTSEIVARSDFGFSTDARMGCGAELLADDGSGSWVTEADCAGGPDFEVTDDMVGDSSRRDRSTKIVTRA